MQCEAPHEKWPIKITLKIPLNPSTSTPSLLHATLVAAWCQVTLCSDTSRPQAHIWDRSRPSVRRYTLRQICKKSQKKIILQHCKRSERSELGLFPKKIVFENETFLIIFKHCEKTNFCHSVSVIEWKKNYGKCRVDQSRLIWSLFPRPKKGIKNIFWEK